MPDASYRNVNFLFSSKGISARSVDDTLEQGWLLNENNCEELAENAISNRLGISLVNRTGNTVFPLSGPPHSLAKLSSLNSLAYRYAGAGANLYRRPAAGVGPYTLISSSFSGSPWQSQVYGSTEFTALPYIFFADKGGMFKDNGTLAAPQQMGIFQPQYPVTAVAQAPSAVQLDPAPGGTYTTTGVTSFADNVVIYPNTTLTSAVTATGLQAVTVANPEQMALYQNVHIGTGGGGEVLVVLKTTPTGFVAKFTKTHAIGAVVQGYGLEGTVQSNGEVNCAFAGKPIPAFGTLQQADYIGLQLFISDPSDVQQIVLKFDCGDGSFDTDYFYKVIGQGALQNLLDSVNQPSTAATDAIVTEALGVYGNADGSIAQLNVGMNVWTSLLMQLSDFSGAGRADFNDTTYNWQNVNGYQLTIVTNNNASESVDFKMASLILVGGSGPDSFAGVAYDYLFTFFNATDGTESNPCMVMSDVNPPNQTNWVYPRRQPVLLTMNTACFRQGQGAYQDSQITHVRIYRRGGTLGDNYRRVDQIQINIEAAGLVQYTDTSTDVDIQENDIISFTNDVPVTSTLPVPVNTTLTAALNPAGAGQALTVHVGSMANISIGQQVSIGTIGSKANNFETVIVLSNPAGGFLAYVQNSHAVGEPVTATAFYGQPVSIMAQAFVQFWFAGDSNNPHFLYYSPANSPQYVSSAAYIQVGTPDDPITAIVGFKGNLYVSTQKFWWAVAPGTSGTPTVYPTAAKHGCVAPNGVVATEEAIFYQAIDGIRAFAGGASTYLTQNQEFIWQGVGSSPIVEADQQFLSQTIMAYWNMMLYVSYVGIDGNRYRMILHMVYKRWRNDDLNATSMILEADTNTLIFGNNSSNIHIDRQNQAYDETSQFNVLTPKPIHVNLQTPYSDAGEPSITKSYQELTLDINTNGETLSVYLWFEDGQYSFLIGTVSTPNRQKVNFQLNNNLGYEYYKVSLQLVGDVSNFIYAFQASLKSLPLAKTRKTFDTFQLKLGTDESKIVKQVYIEYTSTAAIAFNVYYDDGATPGYAFTLPSGAGVRMATRIRLPAISFRMIRFIGSSGTDFQIWRSSKIDMKPLCEGKGYQQIEFMPDG